MTKPATSVAVASAPPILSPPTPSSSALTALTTTSTSLSAPPPPPAAPSPPASRAIPTDWSQAQRRAHERITAIQTQRNAEASSPSLARRIFNSDLGAGVIGLAKERPAFRVGQLDTELLDEELLDLLKEQLMSGVKYLKPNWTESHTPELLLLLRAALFKLSIWDNSATYGATLQNLHYIDARTSRPPTRTQKSLYGAVTVLGRYLYSRLDTYLIQNPTAYPRLGAWMDRLSNLHSILSLFSFLAFLRSGRYRTILDRVLRMRLVPPDNTVAREVSFEFLNRQLVWHAFTEFLLFILPILRVGKWRRWWARFSRKMNTSTSTTGPEGVAKNGELGFLPEKTCAICYKESNSVEKAGQGSGGIAASVTDVTNPYATVECGCVYCYVCVATKIQLEEGEGWECLRCGTLCRKCKPWKGEVVEAVGMEVGGEGKEEGGVESEGEEGTEATSEANTVVHDESDGSEATERGWRDVRAESRSSRWEEEEEDDVFATANASEVESDDEGEVRRIF